MRIANLLRPYYVYRPTQALRHLARTIAPSAGPVHATLPWGATLEIDPGEEIGHAIWHNGLCDLCVSEALWRLLPAGGIAVDAGANIGAMTSLLAARAGAHGRVFAFEPNPALHARLARNLAACARLAGYARVTPSWTALSDTTGEGTLVTDARFRTNQGTAFLVAGSAPATATQSHRVPTARLDDVVGDTRIDVMKVDVEGHEAALFRGAERLLRRWAIRHVVYEDHAGGTSPVHQQLEAHGYTVLALGWHLKGLAVGDRSARLARDDEAANYLATTDAPAAVRTLRASGWRVLRGTR